MVSSTIGNFYCDVCKRRFVTEDGFQAHIRTSKDHKRELSRQSLIAQAEKMRVASHIPSSSSTNQSQTMAIDRRSVIQVEPRIRALWCEICNRGFVKEQGLQAHLRTSKDHKKELDRLEASRQTYQSLEMPLPSLSSMVLETQVINTLQSHMAAIQLNNTTPRCGLCDRVFVTEDALQSHVENSKVHKKEVKRQEKELNKAVTLIPGTASSTMLYGHQSYGPAINFASCEAATLTALQLQAPNISIYGAY